MNWIEKVNAEIVRKTNSVTVCEVEQNHEKNNIRSSNDESELQHELSCGNCGTTFVRYCDLENHLIEVHKKEKNFKCNTCQKDFMLEWRLKKHILIHASSSVKPFTLLLESIALLKIWAVSFCTIVMKMLTKVNNQEMLKMSKRKY